MEGRDTLLQSAFEDAGWEVAAELSLGPFGGVGTPRCSCLPHPPLCVHRVVQNVVLLSDSRLHLFLQSQLSVPETEACVQGQGPQTVTEAILHCAMSNCGWVEEPLEAFKAQAFCASCLRPHSMNGFCHSSCPSGLHSACCLLGN
uniref:Uncharacterized protein n=1 Tax=Strigops habroptila TaxID=2489341 RepID=A0A672U9V4_STRHB